VIHAKRNRERRIPMKRGAQLGNQNARRKHTRLAPSFSGVALELAYEWLAELGEPEPTPERVKRFIVERFELAAKARR
jgi:hypothetical protein